jgi:hypothetical protein
MNKVDQIDQVGSVTLPDRPAPNKELAGLVLKREALLQSEHSSWIRDTPNGPACPILLRGHGLSLLVLYCGQLGPLYPRFSLLYYTSHFLEHCHSYLPSS